MARSERYDPEQWQYMTKAETQARIREALSGYLFSFLDSAPEGSELSRVKEVLSMLKKYFEREYRLAEAGDTFDLERSSIAETVLMSLSPMMKHLPTDEDLEAEIAKSRNRPPPTPEEIEEWERFKRWLSKHGVENLWDR